MSEAMTEERLEEITAKAEQETLFHERYPKAKGRAVWRLVVELIAEDKRLREENKKLRTPLPVSNEYIQVLKRLQEI